MVTPVYNLLSIKVSMEPMIISLGCYSELEQTLNKNINRKQNLKFGSETGNFIYVWNTVATYRNIRPYRAESLNRSASFRQFQDVQSPRSSHEVPDGAEF